MVGRMAVIGGALVLLMGATALVTVNESTSVRGSTAEAAQASPASQSRSGVGNLGWLAGCWERTSGLTVVEEQWMRPRGGAMLGMSRTVRRDTLVEYEHLRIHDRGERTVYTALPSGQAMTEFETGATGDSVVTFENPAHDFPQRIIYRRRGPDSLAARIEGTRAGQMRAVDFRFRRAEC